MKGAPTVAIVVSLAAVAPAVDAQWLNYPTPNIPRTSDGKPNLAAPAPRGADGHIDLSGPWTGRPGVIGVPDEALTATSKTLVREREENYFRDRPAFNCQPSGPEPMLGWRRIIQTPSLIAIAYENLTYHLIFMDGRTLEANPERTWMGYSVGRWEGDTLVVDSFGFNDRTWLDGRGLPHTDALRTTERYVRRNFGQLQVELTVTDPVAFANPWTMTYTLEFQPDTEMIESVCEERSRWIGRLSDVEQSAVAVSPETLAKYVGVYSGLWVTRPRTVRIQLEGGTLYANGLLGEKVRLIPHSETSFSGTDGLSFDFDPDGNPAAFMVERHVSGDWRYTRQPQK
ncbi:MAG TPA: hypothetical protein VFB92_07315 [Vicinamibacterales bacterium]|nr:hypothetical protein [Vicinamibacterales bacterium]